VKTEIIGGKSSGRGTERMIGGKLKRIKIDKCESDTDSS
jgi:hypothetical protein